MHKYQHSLSTTIPFCQLQYQLPLSLLSRGTSHNDRDPSPGLHASINGQSWQNVAGPLGCVHGELHTYRKQKWPLQSQKTGYLRTGSGGDVARATNWILTGRNPIKWRNMEGGEWRCSGGWQLHGRSSSHGSLRSPSPHLHIGRLMNCLKQPFHFAQIYCIAVSKHRIIISEWY